jgi:hypothetical protein
MPKLSRFRKNLLAFLLAAALVPLACRELVMLMVRANGNYGTQDTFRRSSRKAFGKRFLHQLNCQSLEVREKFQSQGGAMSPACPEALSACRSTAASLAAPLEKRSFPTAFRIPLRI